jgi:hypothetical protein
MLWVIDWALDNAPSFLVGAAFSSGFLPPDLILLIARLIFGPTGGGLICWVIFQTMDSPMSLKTICFTPRKPEASLMNAAMAICTKTMGRSVTRMMNATLEQSVSAMCGYMRVKKSPGYAEWVSVS